MAKNIICNICLGDYDSKDTYEMQMVFSMAKNINCNICLEDYDSKDTSKIQEKNYWALTYHTHAIITHPYM